MPIRKPVLVTNKIYHIFNQGINGRFTFNNRREYLRSIMTMKFYQYNFLPTKLSVFLLASDEHKKKIWQIIIKNCKRLVDIICFCFMPNHFHFLLKQKADKGISKFMANFQNSYTRYFNTKNKNKGPIFYNQFKAVLVSTDEQLLHVSRYIHLNPYSSSIIKNIDNLKKYPWSSFPEYLGEVKNKTCQTKIINDFFSSKNKYKNFVFNQADYQRNLYQIKQLILDG